MKKLKFLFLALLFAFASTGFAQTRNIATVSVPNDTVYFGKNLPTGTLVYNSGTQKTYMLIAPATALNTLKSANRIAIADSLFLLQNYIPYTGANKDVNLGSHALTVQRILPSFNDNIFFGIYNGIDGFGNPTIINGSDNIAIGPMTLYSSGDVSYNIGIGIQALENVVGNNNVGIGAYTLDYGANTENTGVGYNVLALNKSSYNTAVGSWAGRGYNTWNENGTRGVYIGAYAQALYDNSINEIVIGAYTTGAGSNSVTLGNNEITKTILRGNVLVNDTINATGSQLSVKGNGYFDGSLTTTGTISSPNIQNITDSIAALRTDVNTFAQTKVERFTAIQDQEKFGLSSELTISNLVFVNGILADDTAYSGVGTDTLTFSTPLAANDRVTVFYSYGSSIQTYWYGVEWDTTVADPVVTRIGNVEYQTTLPVQSRMARAVVTDSGTINYYLDPHDSNKKADGTAADLTGASGQVMVIIPTHWVRYETDGTKRRIEISTVALPGFTKVPEYAVGAYDAYYNTTTGKLESRSGVMPTTALTRAQFRSYAAARGTGWHEIDYNEWKDIFYLYLTEYATFNIQAVIPGATNASSTDWGNYNGYNPVVENGVSNAYGNYSASVPFTVANFIGDTADLNSQVADYRGIENIYGHIWQFVDGVNAYYPDTISGARVYVDADPSTFADDDSTNYVYIGNTPAVSGWIRSLLPDSWLPATDAGASSSTYMTDYHSVSSTQTGVWRVVRAGGGLSAGSNAGLLYSSFGYSSSGAFSNVGGRLCLKITQ